MSLPAILPATSRQIPDHSIFDYYNKQTYLGNQYSASLTTTVGTSELPILLLRSVSTSLALFQNLLNVVSLTASNNVVIKVYVNPTVTGNGTPLSPVNNRVAYGNNSKGLLTSAPSVSANGTLVNIISSQSLINAQSNILTVLDNAQSLLVTATASSASTSVETLLGWYEL